MANEIKEKNKTGDTTALLISREEFEKVKKEKTDLIGSADKAISNVLSKKNSFEFLSSGRQKGGE